MGKHLAGHHPDGCQRTRDTPAPGGRAGSERLSRQNRSIRSSLSPRIRNELIVKQHYDHLQQYSEELEAAVLRRTAELARSRQEVIHCLARAAEFRDDFTGRHVAASAVTRD